jgi:putative membrane protein
MPLIARRSLLLGAMVAVPAAYAFPALALDALPDARFVGFAQQVNDFEIASGRLALTKSSNENIRGFASRMIADHTNAAELLAKARSEAGVSYAPDPNARPHTVTILQRLNGLDGNEFDTAYANAQLAVLSEAEQQYAANSANVGSSAGSASTGVMMRYARNELPRMQAHRDLARALAGGR